MTAGVFAAAAAGGGAPTKSLQFVAATGQYFSKTAANYGAGVFNHDKFSISGWFKRASTGAMLLYTQDSVSADLGPFRLSFNGSNQIDFQTASSSGVTNGRKTTTASYSSTTVFYHIAVLVDIANATAGDRIKIYVNGTRITSFSSSTDPAVTPYTSTGEVSIGYASSFSNFYDGLIYQLSLFSNELIDPVTIYNGGVPVSLRSDPFLFSSLGVAGGNVRADDAQATLWSNNGGVVASAVTP